MECVYILHQRRYSDSRIILELWAEHSGRIAGLFRAGRKHGSTAPMLFSVYEAEWRGRGELKTLTVCEPGSLRSHRLSGIGAMCGLYLNELLIRCLQPGDPHPQVFSFYQKALTDLQQTSELQQAEPVLRYFETRLLEQLGLGVDFFHCCDSGNPVLDDKLYQLVVDEGFRLSVSNHNPRLGIFQGQEILAMGRFALMNAEQRRAAKWMTRQLLAPVLGDRPLKSRELFASSPTQS